jgi:hypothetical protein
MKTHFHIRANNLNGFMVFDMTYVAVYICIYPYGMQEYCLGRSSQYTV